MFQQLIYDCSRRTILSTCALLLLTSYGSMSTPPTHAQTEQFTIHLPLVSRTEPPYTLTCNPSLGSGGLSVGNHEITVAGANAVVVVGEGYDPTQPTYLAYYIHSHSGEYLDFKSPSNKVTEFVRDRGWIFVAPQAPDGVGWGKDETSTVDVDLFKRILDEMVGKYNVCHDILFGSGASNGSYFWDTRLFPEIGHEYPAFMIMNCGAGLWEYWIEAYGSGDRIRALAKQDEIVKRTRIKYVYGSEDFLYDNIQASSNFMHDVGFTVIVDERAGVDHCSFNIYGETSSYWRSVANELGDP